LNDACPINRVRGLPHTNKEVAVSRFVHALLVAAAAICLVTPSAGANPNNRLGGTLGDLWTTVLQTPTPENPFNPGGGNTCIDLGDHTVAPFGPNGAQSCTVEPGTKIFASAWTTECSTFEGNGTTEAELRACARATDAGITTHTIAVDGQPVPVSEVETELLTIHLPADNIFGLTGADRNGLSVAHGWVTLIHPLPPGTHTIDIHVAGTVNLDVQTTIIVI
jgi:hypothetical protein